MQSTPGDQNKLKVHSYDDSSKIYAEFVKMNTGLGNRGPVVGFKQHKICLLCARKKPKT